MSGSISTSQGVGSVPHALSYGVEDIERLVDEFESIKAEHSFFDKAFRQHLKSTSNYVSSCAALAVQLAGSQHGTKHAPAARDLARAHACSERIQLASVQNMFLGSIFAPMEALKGRFRKVDKLLEERDKILGFLSKHKESSKYYYEYKQLLEKNLNDVVFNITEMLDERKQGTLFDKQLKGLVSSQMHLANDTSMKLSYVLNELEEPDKYLSELQESDSRVLAGIQKFAGAKVKRASNAQGSKNLGASSIPQRSKPPSGTAKEPVFGVLQKGSNVPEVVYKCCEFIRQNPAGAFTQEGDSEIVQTLKELFNSEYANPFNQVSTLTVHEAATLLLVYLDELPELLFPKKIATILVKIYQEDSAFGEGSISSQGRAQIFNVVETLTSWRAALFGVIFKMLQDVAHSPDGTNSETLAAVFAPYLMNPGEALGSGIAVLKILIEGDQSLAETALSTKEV